jgi:hypothetical protein
MFNHDELNLIRLSLTGFGSGFDLIALIVFVAVAAIYVLVPALGYESRRRGAIVVALYALVGFAGVTLGQMLLQWAEMAEMVRPDAFGRGPRPLQEGPGQLSLLFLFSFATMKMFLFVAALICFVIGLQRLRLRPPELPAVVEEKTRGE